ncbi:MAG: SpoIIE family protein phosphatase [Acidobacteriaceae bacterium]
MRKHRFVWPGLCVGLVCGLFCPALRAQITVTVPAGGGASAVNWYTGLDGVWRFQPGDSPESNGRFLWASPEYDDSGWAKMELRSSSRVIDPVYQYGGYLPGWSALGYPKLAGYAWYRLHIHVNHDGSSLWIKMPGHVDDGYQLFANGKLVGSFGKFTSRGVAIYRSRPLIFPLPAPDAAGNIQLAIRFYLSPISAVDAGTHSTGGMHELPVIGFHRAVILLLKQERQELILNQMIPAIVSFLMMLAAAGFFCFWIYDRSEKTYLWLTIALLSEGMVEFVMLAGLFSFWLTQDQANSPALVVPSVAMFFWILVWQDWFGIWRERLSRWVRWTGLASVLLAVGSAIVMVQLDASYRGGYSAAEASLRWAQLNVCVSFALGALVLVTLFQAYFKDRVGALLAMVPIVLTVVGFYGTNLRTWWKIHTNHFFASGLNLRLGDAAGFLLVIVLAVLVGRRFLRTRIEEQLRKQSMEQDLEQARALQQQVLVPEAIESSFFAVKTAYYAARTVGGDFFQAIPRPDGSLVIVLGDVSGKGMAAAMLVAVLVGAARTKIEETCDPVEILRVLNERLLGRANSHFATCVVAHLRPGGVMVIANAGHLQPYRNGVEMELPGSLPLGLVAGVEYEAASVQLEAEDYLTFMTDGVVEAQNASGELLGFERVEGLAGLEPESIARAAMEHGQEDDITVVGVRVLKLAGDASMVTGLRADELTGGIRG